MVHYMLALLITFTVTKSYAAENLFEGYSKVVVNGQHSGYVISRYEFDAKKNQFHSTYFLKTGKGAGEITESLKSIATADLTPVSYEYTSVIGRNSKTIDAKFKNSTMTAIVKTNGKISRIEKKLPKGVFLSNFLVYLMLKSKEGLKSESKYEYQAIAEEDGSLQKGQALVGKEEAFNGFTVFKILNTFKDEKFLSYVNDRGEVLGTNVMSQGVSTEIVANPSEATKGQSVNSTLLAAVFSGVPKGENNVASRGKKGLTPNPKAGGKTEGIPGGEGILIKPANDGTKMKNNEGN